MLIEDILLDLDCIVIGPVGTVAQALALLHREEIDGALLDVNLGGGERSYPVADALAARDVPFVFVTGYGEAGVEGRYAPVTVLQKPFDPRRLERVVANDLAGSSRRAARQARR
jgi:two-component SAPR family response regulator